MGAKQSSNSGKDGSSHAVPSLKHPIVLSGLDGSGRSSVQKALGLSNGRVVRPDMRFLTTPRLLDSDDPSAGGFGLRRESPGYGLGSRWRVNDDASSPFLYGGRGSVTARWIVAGYSTRAIVFVVDSTDRARVAHPEGWKPLPDEFVLGYGARSPVEQAEMEATLESQLSAKELLHNLLHEHQYDTKPLIVLANKQDAEGAMTPAELCEALDLQSIQGRDWRISGCSAATGEGLAEALDWLNYVIAHPTDFKDALQKRFRKGERIPNWMKRNAAHNREQKRHANIDRGFVPRAPPLFKTNGELVEATPEQKREFIVAGITDPDDVEEQAKKQQLMKAAQSEEAEEALSLLETVLQSIAEQEKGDGTDKQQEQEQEGGQPASPAASTESDESSDASSSPSPLPELQLHRESSSHGSSDGGSSVASESEDETESVSFHAPTVTHTPEPTMHEEPSEEQSNIEAGKAAQHVESLKVQPLPSEAADRSLRFSSLSSSALVLPRSTAIPRAKLELRKKHWYSRRPTMQPVKEQEVDIHKQVQSWGIMNLI